jgi:hypothetical protein
MPACSQAQCKIAETGVCLEGHQQGCPHLLPDQETIPAPVPPPVSTPPIPEPRRFYTGEKFTVPETSRIMNAKPALVILCAGSRKSGKTTFLARIGEMFRDGSFAEYKFAWCYTLCGFERASWHATIVSGGSRPDTMRTGRLENDKFLHLRVRPADNKLRKIDLLISDLAGETFPTAVATREFCVGLQALARCDHLVVFLDSARLMHSTDRHTECDNVIKFLQRASEVRVHPKMLHVQVVFSRWDYVHQHNDASAGKKYCDSIEQDLIRKFKDVFATVAFRRIAARPNAGIVATDTEIQSLFGHWIETPLQQPPKLAARNLRPVRDFCAFGLP